LGQGLENDGNWQDVDLQFVTGVLRSKLMGRLGLLGSFVLSCVSGRDSRLQQ